MLYVSRAIGSIICLYVGVEAIKRYRGRLVWGMILGVMIIIEEFFSIVNYILVGVFKVEWMWVIGLPLTCVTIIYTLIFYVLVYRKEK